MIDTLRIHSENVSIDRIKEHASFNSVYNKDKELISLHATEYLNETNNTKDKKLYNGTVRFDYSAEKKYLNIGLSSASAFLYGTSFKTVERNDIQRLIEQLQHLANNFVEIDIANATVSRLDNSTLYSMNRPVNNYISLLNELSHTKQFHCSKKYYEGETIEFFNKQRTIGFYDKYAKNIQNELESKLISSQNLTNNELRYEIQNKKSSAIKKAFGLKNSLKLYEIDSDYLEEKLYKQRITEFKKHFKLQHYKEFNSEDLINTISYMRKKHKRTAYYKALEYLCLKEGYITSETVKEGLSASGHSRQSISKRINNLKEMLQYDINKTELYEELTSKIKVA